MDILLVVCFAVTLEKIKGIAGSSTTDGSPKMLHDEAFKRSIIKPIIKINRDCQVITQEIMDLCNER